MIVTLMCLLLRVFLFSLDFDRIEQLTLTLISLHLVFIVDDNCSYHYCFDYVITTTNTTSSTPTTTTLVFRT